jgi:hypothetical protein
MKFIIIEFHSCKVVDFISQIADILPSKTVPAASNKGTARTLKPKVKHPKKKVRVEEIEDEDCYDFG